MTKNDESIRLLLIDDAKRGLADITAGRTHEADAAIAQIQERRASAKPLASCNQSGGDA